MTTMTKSKPHRSGRPYKAPRTSLDKFVKAQGLPIKTVAERCGVSRQSVQYWLTNKKKPNYSALASAFGITVDELKDEIAKNRSVEDIEKTMNFEDVNIDFHTAVELVPVEISNSHLQGGTDSWDLYKTIKDVTGFEPSLRVFDNYAFGVSCRLENHTLFLAISGGRPGDKVAVTIDIMAGNVDETIHPDDTEDVPVATAYVLIPKEDDLFVKVCRFVEQVFPVLQGQLSES